jgi:hypothetical protein
MSEKETVIVGSFDITTNLPKANGGQIVFHGYLYAADTSKEINARVDQLQEAAKRQFEREGMEVRYAERTKWLHELDRNKEAYAQLADKKKAGMKLKTQEQTAYEQAERSQKTILENIQTIENGIEETKKKYGFT